MKLRKQGGLATLEMALVSAVTITTIIAVLEIARAAFVFNTLEEVTRRGARMAAICPINSDAISEAAVFATTGLTSSSVVAGLTTSHISVEYLNETGSLVGSPAGNIGSIEYVRVRVLGFSHRFVIPGFNTLVTTPNFVTTVPRESLGFTPNGTSSC